MGILTGKTTVKNTMVERFDNGNGRRFVDMDGGAHFKVIEHITDGEVKPVDYVVCRHEIKWIKVTIEVPFDTLLDMYYEGVDAEKDNADTEENSYVNGYYTGYTTARWGDCRWLVGMGEGAVKQIAELRAEQAQ